MKHRKERAKAVESAIRVHAWALGRDTVLLAKLEAWLRELVAVAEKRAGRELSTEEALDCIKGATYGDFDRVDKTPLVTMAYRQDQEVNRLRTALLAAGITLPEAP